MEFYQVIDPVSLTPISWVYVVSELIMALMCAIVLGVCLQVVPAKLVPRSRRNRRQIPRKSGVPTLIPEQPAQGIAKISEVSSLPKKHQAPPGPAVIPRKKIPFPSVSSEASEHALNNALDSFFENEKILDETLVDTEAYTAPVDGSTAASKSRLSPPPRAAERTLPANSQPGGSLAELADRTMRNVQRPATKGSAPPPTSHSLSRNKKNGVDAVDENLESALNAYMEEEQLLNEAMLDSVLKEARSV